MLQQTLLDMSAPTVDLVAALREARMAVLPKLRAVRRTLAGDTKLLRDLQRSLRMFASYADCLVLVLLDREAESALVAEVERLCNFFWSAEAEVGARLQTRH